MYLRTVDEDAARRLKLKPGQKLCRFCYEKEPSQSEQEQRSSTDDDTYEPLDATQESLNTSSSLLGCSPLKPVSQRDKPSYAKRKVQGLQKAITSKVAKVLNVPTKELPSTEMITPCEKSEDLDKFIELLKEKCHHASRKEKIKLLTLVPSSWSIKKTMEEFNISQYMVKRVREIKNKKGILEEPDPKKGKSLSPEVIERVIAFYQSDDYSRMCPGKKEYVSVRIDGKREQKQKRLLLVNLKELHLEFIKSTGDEISFSKFCELRPKWCVTVNSRGMHSVCVCQQYLELMGKGNRNRSVCC